MHFGKCSNRPLWKEVGNEAYKQDVFVENSSLPARNRELIKVSENRNLERYIFRVLVF